MNLKFYGLNAFISKTARADTVILDAFVRAGLPGLDRVKPASMKTPLASLKTQAGLKNWIRIEAVCLNRDP